jgi:phosphoribosylaminoimidazole-succinocarboxamide synthase
MPSTPLLHSTLPALPLRRGKVRDVYDLGDELVIVATDRISAFDWVLPSGIPDKGRILTQLTLFWLDFLGVPNHLICTELKDMGPAFVDQRDVLTGRTMLVKKAEVVPVECVARGYLAGSGWKDYLRTGAVCGVPLPGGLKESQQLPEPIFTPATKEESGHDINISFDEMSQRVGKDTANTLRERTLAIYSKARDYAASRGLLIADTKFEFGRLPNGELILIDEVLTPDSSRFWPADQHQIGMSPPSFDKQFVRNWLETTTWDKNSPPPPLPEEIIAKTRAKYVEAYERLTGRPFNV